MPTLSREERWEQKRLARQGIASLTLNSEPRRPSAGFGAAAAASVYAAPRPYESGAHQQKNRPRVSAPFAHHNGTLHVYANNGAGKAPLEEPRFSAKKSNTRILAPPGGSSSITFGDARPSQLDSHPSPRDDQPPRRAPHSYQDPQQHQWNNPAAAPSFDKDQRHNIDPRHYADPRQHQHHHHHHHHQQQQHQQHQYEPVQYGRRPPLSSNSFANGASQNSGNYVTKRSSTRVSAPPGGHSSISFG